LFLASNRPEKFCVSRFFSFLSLTDRVSILLFFVCLVFAQRSGYGGNKPSARRRETPRPLSYGSKKLARSLNPSSDFDLMGFYEKRKEAQKKKREKLSGSRRRDNGARDTYRKPDGSRRRDDSRPKGPSKKKKTKGDTAGDVKDAIERINNGEDVYDVAADKVVGKKHPNVPHRSCNFEVPRRTQGAWIF
jgi:hypothetical protein